MLGCSGQLRGGPLRPTGGGPLKPTETIVTTIEGTNLAMPVSVRRAFALFQLAFVLSALSIFGAPEAVAATDYGPVGNCVWKLSNKFARSQETALSVAEYIADKCMELQPPPNCQTGAPDTVDWAVGQKWLEIDRQANVERREATRVGAYNIIVALRREAAERRH
jgi:hypothetical protein